MDTARVTVERLPRCWNLLEFSTVKGKMSFVIPSHLPSQGRDDVPLKPVEVHEAVELAKMIAASFLQNADLHRTEIVDLGPAKNMFLAGSSNIH